MTNNTHDAESVLREGARLIVRNGRAWLKLTDEDVERGARAIERDPYYRAELYRSAVLHARETGNPDGLIDRLYGAYMALAQEERRQRHSDGSGAEQ
jgi:hypothetical protein